MKITQKYTPWNCLQPDKFQIMLSIWNNIDSIKHNKFETSVNILNIMQGKTKYTFLNRYNILTFILNI